LKSQILIIASFFLLLVHLSVAALWIPEAKTAITFIAGAFGSELAHLARKSAE
jgi:Na+/H+-translocating membrane pyrophosphatase